MARRCAKTKDPLQKKNPASLGVSTGGGHVLYNLLLFLRLVTFNSESYSVHVVSLCVHVRVPYVRMRHLGGGGGILYIWEIIFF